MRNPRRGRGQEQAIAHRLLIGRTDGGRVLTLVVERTQDPGTWLLITGWEATARERKLVEIDMAADPWTAPDPQPGDFDDELAAVDPRDLQVVEAGSGGKVTILVSVEGDDAKLFERIATERGQAVDEVIADLVPHA